MASVILRGNELVVSFNDGTIRPTNVKVAAGDDIAAKVRDAIGTVKIFAMAAGKGPELNKINVNAAVRTISGQLQGMGPRRTETKQPRAPEAAKPKAAIPKEEAKQKAPAPRPKEVEEAKERIVRGAKEQVKAAARPLSEIKPRQVTITDAKGWKRNPVGWIKDRMAEAQTNDQKSNAAVTSLAVNAELKAFLSPDAQRGVERTAAQKATTIAVFNELYRIPKFYQYLVDKTQNEERMKANPECTLLQIFLSQTKDQRLTGNADQDTLKNVVIQAQKYMPNNITLTPETVMQAVIQAADMLMRDYLLLYVGAESGGNPNLRKEMSQLPNMNKRMTMLNAIDKAEFRSKVARGNQAGGAMDSDAAPFRKNQLSGAMDSDTVVSAALYLRRWYLPGKGIPTDQITEWKSPAEEVRQPERAAALVTPAPSPLPEAAKPPEKPKELTPLEQFAETNWNELSKKILDAVKAGNPAEIARIMRNLPQGYSDLPSALKKLGRSDIQDAFDAMFNNLHENKEFLAFAASKAAYRYLARDKSIKLSPSSTPYERMQAANAAQDFIMYNAARANDPASARLNGDIRTLYNDVLGSGVVVNKAGIPQIKDGMPDMRTIAAAAVYFWRKAHTDAPEGEWARNIPGVTISEPLKPAATPPEQKTKQRVQLQF